MLLEGLPNQVAISSPPLRGPGSPGDWGFTPAGPPNRLPETLSTIAVNRRGPPSMRRAELGIHGLNRWTAKCLENAEFKLTKRPERGQKYWQCLGSALRTYRSPSPCVAKPEIIRSRRVHPVSVARETWLERKGPATLWHPGYLVGLQRPPGHCSPAPRPTLHAPRQTSGVRSCADPPPPATACHRPPKSQRPNGARSRRAIRLYSVCHRIRRFVRTNQGILPTRRRSTVDHSLVAGGAQRQWLQA